MKNLRLNKILCASVMMAFGCAGASAQGVIHTIAGTGVSSFSGDGGPANLATFASPYGVATDASSNVYIADYYNHRVRKITATTGVISTIAGSGSGMYMGMGGPALAAGMEYPNSVFAEPSGNISVTDFFADCSYFVDHTTGVISNSCGNNNQGNDDDMPGPLAKMELPRGIWKDAAGNTFIADYGNNRVRRLNATDGLVHTLTGSSLHGFSPDGTSASACLWGSIMGVCVDNYGNVYVSDGSNHVVRRIDAAGNVRTIAGSGTPGYAGDGGPAVNAKLMTPGALFVNAAGNLFICDAGNNTVRVVNVLMAASTIKTVAGTGVSGFSGDGGPANAAMLNQPSGIWQDALGVIYIADMGNQRIRTITGSGLKETPSGVAVTTLGEVNIYPNPSNGSFTVLGTSLPQNTLMEVFNMMGQKVYTQTINQQNTVVNLDQPAGMYNVTLSAKGAVSNTKIIIQN